MDVKPIVNIRLPTIVCSLLLLSTIMSSCDNEWPDDYCNCHQGGTIGGWEDGNDTDIHPKDSTAGFEIHLEHWDDTCKINIVI